MLNGTCKFRLPYTIGSKIWKCNIPKIKYLISLAQHTFYLVFGSNCNNFKFEISITFVDDATIATCNNFFFKKHAPTNVLSFPTIELDCKWSSLVRYIKSNRYHILGDVMLSYETIERESTEQDKLFLHHISHLFVHSILHLIGFDHITEHDRKIMEKIEIEIMKNFNINNPFA